MRQVADRDYLRELDQSRISNSRFTRNPLLFLVVYTGAIYSQCEPVHYTADTVEERKNG